MNVLGALVSLAALGALVSRAARGSRPGTQNSLESNELVRPGSDPRRYGAAKVSLLRSRWDNPDIRAVLARLAEPGGLLEGAPATALLGLTATSTGPRERGGAPDYVRGWWNLTRADRGRYAADDETRRTLGRAVSARDDEAWFRDLVGQGYLGARSQVDNWRAVERTLPAALHAPAGDPWALRVGAAAYSSGPARVSALVKHYATDLSAVPSADRWGRLRELVVRDGPTVQSLGGVPVRGRWRAAHLLLRNDQRAEAAAALARKVDPSSAHYLGSLLSDLPVAEGDSQVNTLSRLAGI